MTTKLQVNDLSKIVPRNPFLILESNLELTDAEAALESPLFDFNTTDHMIGARVVSIPPNRAFAKHIHPNAYHFIYVVEGTAILEYDSQVYILKSKQCCLVEKGVAHKLGAGEDGTTVIVTNTPTYDNGDPRHVCYLEEETLDSKHHTQ